MAVFTTTMFSNSLHRLTELTAIVPIERPAGIPEELRNQADAPMKTIMLLHGFPAPTLTGSAAPALSSWP